MIEAGGPIELRDQRWEIGAETPLVRSPSCHQDALLPPVPPRRDESGDRLDDEEPIRFARLISLIRATNEGLSEQRLARLVRQLVQRERRQEGQRLPRQQEFTQIDATNSRG